MRWIMLLMSMVVSASCAAEHSSPKDSWEASPSIVLEILDKSRVRITVRNSEARSICINQSYWPGLEGVLSGDDFEVRGENGSIWKYVGIEKYPTRNVINIEPGASLSAVIDLSQYYLSPIVDDRVTSVKWKPGFVYCGSVK